MKEGLWQELLPWKLCGLLFMFSIGFTLSSVFFFLYRSHPFSVCPVFHVISSNMGKVLLTYPYVHVFVFWDFSVNHKYQLIYSNGTYRPVNSALIIDC